MRQKRRENQTPIHYKIPDLEGNFLIDCYRSDVNFINIFAWLFRASKMRSSFWRAENGKQSSDLATGAHILQILAF